MNRILILVFLFIPSLGFADQGVWKYLEVQSGRKDKDWEIYRATVKASLSADIFSTDMFCSVLMGQPNVEHCYRVKGTVKKSNDLYGSDIVATFSPQETEALPTSCKGKYLRHIHTDGIEEEMDFLCNGSNDFRSFRRFIKNAP